MMLSMQVMKKFKLDGAATEKSVKAFLAAHGKGKLPQFHKSAPVKDGWNAAPVLEIAASQFEARPARRPASLSPPRKLHPNFARQVCGARPGG
jgi:hypothetical protein